MDILAWGIFGIIILLALVLVIILFIKREKIRKIDYHNFFIIGIVWLGAGVAIGISSGLYWLFIMGLIFTTIGLIHKKQWKQNIKDRKKILANMSKKDKKRLMIIKWVLIGLVLLGILAFVVVEFFRG